MKSRSLAILAFAGLACLSAAPRPARADDTGMLVVADDATHELNRSR